MRKKKFAATAVALAMAAVTVFSVGNTPSVKAADVTDKSAINIAVDGDYEEKSLSKADMEAIANQMGYEYFGGDFVVCGSNTTAYVDWENSSIPYWKAYDSFVLVPVLSRDDPMWLYIYFRRSEFCREVTFRNFGSQRPEFNFNDMSDIIIPLPDIEIQKKYVDVYNAMIENQKSYERGLNDLKLVCDAYIDKLKHSKEKVPIGKFIVQIDNRNKKNCTYSFKGLSMDNYFINSIADSNGLDFSNYKIVVPGEYGAVLMKVGRDGRLTIARNDSKENYLISPAYYTFETIGIDSDYFMANVNRSEFERRGWFSCDTSARGSLSWEEFLGLSIPNADEREQEIVAELHNVLILRTQINEKLKAQIKDICPILIKGSIEEARKAKEA